MASKIGCHGVGHGTFNDPRMRGALEVVSKEDAFLLVHSLARDNPCFYRGMLDMCVAANGGLDKWVHQSSPTP